MATSPYRERYELLIERRRALLELETLDARIREHPAWHQACMDDPALDELLDVHRLDLSCHLCDRACQAGSEALLCDVRRITTGLVELARIWVALEDGLSPRDVLEGGRESLR